MSYICPVCGETTAAVHGMCVHMQSARLRTEEHRRWIEAHGINFPSSQGYLPLKEAVERECKIREKTRG